MTEQQALKAMLDRANVKYHETSDGTGATIEVYGNDGPLNHGYAGFVCRFRFVDGSLVDVGVWE